MDKKYKFTAANEESSRLDLIVLDYLSTDSDYHYLTRAQIRNWIKGGRVRVNGQEVGKAGYTVKPGDTVEIKMEELSAGFENIEPYEIPLDIVFEDDHLIVINKGPGLAMHPGAGNRKRTVLNALVHYLGSSSADFPDPQRLGIVHRLDKDTTGLIVVAKTLEAHNILSGQFADRSISRRYRALVFTTPRKKRVVQQADSGVIDKFLGRHPRRRTLMAVVKKGGRRAITHWQRMEEMQYGTLLDLVLETGRTHQIRVHLDSVGCPVIGDRSYGDFSGLPDSLAVAGKEFGRQALHAYQLKFIHPRENKEIGFSIDLPSDLRELIEIFRNYGQLN